MFANQLTHTFGGIFNRNGNRSFAWERYIFVDDLPTNAFVGDFIISKCWVSGNRAFWSNL